MLYTCHPQVGAKASASLPLPLLAASAALLLSLAMRALRCVACAHHMDHLNVPSQQLSVPRAILVLPGVW